MKITGRNIIERGQYDEWMLMCAVERIDTKQEVLYYVSRGDDQHTVFLHKRKFSDGRVFVDSYIKNVSVVNVNENNNLEVPCRDAEIAETSIDWVK